MLLGIFDHCERSNRPDPPVQNFTNDNALAGMKVTLAEVFAECCGIIASTGFATSLIGEAGQGPGEFVKAPRTALRRSEVLHLGETGARVTGKRHAPAPRTWLNASLATATTCCDSRRTFRCPLRTTRPSVICGW